MRQLIALFKVEFINTFFTNTRRGKNKKDYSVFIKFIISIVALLYLGFMLAIGMNQLLKAKEYIELPFIIVITMSLVINLFAISIVMFSKVFTIKGNEKLFSMPIKMSRIILVKLGVLYLDSFIINLCFVTPLFVINIMNGYALSFLNLFNYLLFIFTFPLIILSVSLLISYIFSALFSKISIKYKWILNLGAILMVILGVYLNFKIQSIFDSVDLRILSSVIESFKKYLPFIYWGANSFLRQNMLNALLFLLVSIIPFIALVMIVSKNYVRIINNFSTKKLSKEYNFKSIKKSSVYLALIKFELRRYFSVTIWFVNTMGTYILILIGLIYLVFFDKEIVTLVKYIGDIKYFVPILIGASSILSSMNSQVISFDLIYLDSLKVIPVAEKDLFKAKIMFQIILTLPFMILYFIIINFIIDYSVLDILYSTVVIILFSIFSSSATLLFGALKPNYSKEANIIVKRSFASFTNIILMFLYAGLLYLLYFFVIKDIIILSAFNLFVLVVLNAIIIRYLMVNAKKIIRGL